MDNKPIVKEKMKNRGILAMFNRTSVLRPSQLISFPLIANRNELLLKLLKIFPEISPSMKKKIMRYCQEKKKFPTSLDPVLLKQAPDSLSNSIPHNN